MYMYKSEGEYSREHGGRERRGGGGGERERRGEGEVERVPVSAEANGPLPSSG